ncbi:permease [Microtetraspora sp. NBRC 13810]|nr:permease [Microtetraspora sp. NBRC 13810]
MGSLVQGAVGFGVGVAAAPVITLLDPELMPASIMVVNAILPLFTLAAEWRRVDWRDLGWAVLGRLPGSVVGAYIVLQLSARSLALFVGVMVLVAVALTGRAVRVPRNGATIGGAGFVSGITGTATGIGGPPIALVFQGVEGPRVRATLAVFFFLSAVQSLLLLHGVGELTDRQLRFGALMIPFLVAGFALSRPLRRRLDAGLTRTAILVVAAGSAFVLIAQSLVR